MERMAGGNGWKLDLMEERKGCLMTRRGMYKEGAARLGSNSKNDESEGIEEQKGYEA